MGDIVSKFNVLDHAFLPQRDNKRNESANDEILKTIFKCKK